MEGLEGGAPVLVRAGLGLAAFGLVVAGVLAVTDGVAFVPAALPGASVALVPAAATGCDAVGPYRTPERDSVGVPAGLGLCPSGPLTVTVPGTVLDGLDLRGGIVVAAPDVVVRRSRITGDGTTPFGVRTTGEGSVRIEDTTLTGDFTEAAVDGDRWSAERIEITRVTNDGVWLGNGARLRNSFLHSFTPAPGAQSHAVVLRGSAGGLLVEDNRIELGDGPGRRNAVLLAPDGSWGRAGGPVVIRGNVLGGGWYTVMQQPTTGDPGDVWITGNRFRRDAGQGPLRVSHRTVLTDNSYLDGGPLPTR